MMNKSRTRGRFPGVWRLGAVAVLAAALSGCAASGPGPRSMLQDPGYIRYQRAADELDQEYLNKKITFVEYKERKQQLDSRYQRTTKGALPVY